MGGCRASKNPLVLKKTLAAASNTALQLQAGCLRRHPKSSTGAISRVLVLIASLLLAKTHTKYCQHDLQAVLVLPLFCSVLSDHAGNQTPALLCNMTDLEWHLVRMGAGPSLMGPLLCQGDFWVQTVLKRDVKSRRITSVMQCLLFRPSLLLFHEEVTVDFHGCFRQGLPRQPDPIFAN